MNQTICPIKYVASWTVCALVFCFLPFSFGQSTLPRLESVNVPNFTIPFEVAESTNSIREVELLVSKDRGRRWHFVARQSVDSEKFAFRADSDGEYWFAFRTITTAGNPLPFRGHPDLRVAVNTNGAAILPPSQPSQSGPVAPPKPERFRGEKVPKPQLQPEKTDELDGTRENVHRPHPNPLPEGEGTLSSSLPEEERTVRLTFPEEEGTFILTFPAEEEATNNHPMENNSQAAQKRSLLAPKLPGFEPPEPEKQDTENLLDDLLSRMSPFMDVQPVEITRIMPNTHVAAQPAISQVPADPPAGSISRIDLGGTETKPQVVVQWHTGTELWGDAQIDIFRGSTKEGPWSPIAINLGNSGGYWWFLTPEDLKPFYVALRIRSFRGGTQMDMTQSAITVDPAKVFTVQSARSP